MTTVALKKAIQAHAEEVNSLTFREPNGEDIQACGYPFRLSEGQVYPEAGSISKYISRLAKIPHSSVKQLGAEDFNACMAVILGFFGEEEEPPTT
ncbi:phage tail assembly protein [Hwanghaeella sp.]|uniref:phage tail assembly protein n=1 Tax=Hwanghaeella sp. TaxID=2605943 RepID=UPI003CCC3FA9